MSIRLAAENPTSDPLIAALLPARSSIFRLPHVEGDTPKRKFKAYPIGYVHVDLAEVRTAEGKLYPFVAIDRTAKSAFAALHE